MALVKRIKTVFYLLILLLCREGYFWCRNAWGLVVHPYLTLRRVRQENDLSEFFLLYISIVSPLVIAVIASGFFLLLKLIFQTSLPLVGTLIFWFDVWLFLSFLLVGGWFAYWLRKVLLLK
jgi:hypothetical protein